MTKWLADFWKEYLNREDRREDAILALLAVMFARFGGYVWSDILLLTIVVLLVMRLVADWNK